MGKEFNAFSIVGVALLATSVPAHAASDPFIGEVMMTAATFCPRGWTEANGQLVSISENLALFSLLGTTYGGDGSKTFALPDLRGRAPVHVGNGRDVPPLVLGQKGGNSSVARDPAASGTVKTQPTLAIRYCVAIQGIYPSRN